MRISIITTCFNGEHYLAETMRSVLQQSAVLSGRVQLEYIVKDACSTDRTLEIARQFEGPMVKVVSMKDRGLYDGLSQAFAMATGDIVAYLNAGDVYNPHAFDIVADCFADPTVKWLTGARVLYNDRSHVTSFRCPIPYRPRFIRAAVYGWNLPFIHQEATFWRRELLSSLDVEEFRSYRLAGDYYLWTRFVEVADLDVVDTHLGGFKIHDNQLSSDRAGYRKEQLRTRTARLGILDWLKLAFDLGQYVLSPDVRYRLLPQRSLAYDAAQGRWGRKAG